MVAESPARTKNLEALRIARPKEEAPRKRKSAVLLAMVIMEPPSAPQPPMKCIRGPLAARKRCKRSWWSRIEVVSRA